MIWQTFIPVLPTAKGRPKFSMRGGFPRAYTPAKTANAETEIKRHLVKEWKNRPLEGPIALKAIFYCPIPKSTSQKRMDGMVGEPVVTRPDLDNYIKLVADSCNEILWKDDNQIWKIEASKLYSKTPKIYLEISWG